MPHFNKNQEFWRILFGAVAVFFIGISVINYIRYVSLPTDENWFRNSPSNLYVTKSFPVLKTDYQDVHSLPREPTTPDSVHVGDLLVQVNLRLITDVKFIYETLQNSNQDTVFSLLVFRPRLNKYVPFKIAKSAVPDSFFKAIPKTVSIFDVIEGGASDRAGMKKGDLIYRINGVTFRNQHEADAIMRQASVGKAVAYDIIRNNREITLQVTLAKVGINLSILLLCLSGWFFLGVGAFVVVKRAHLRTARLVGLAFLTTGFFMTLLMTMRAPSADTFIIVRT
ncbi:MAG: PDZ domain-containing protein, partial [bacterium]